MLLDKRKAQTKYIQRTLSEGRKQTILNPETTIFFGLTDLQMKVKGVAIVNRAIFY